MVLFATCATYNSPLRSPSSFGNCSKLIDRVFSKNSKQDSLSSLSGFQYYFQKIEELKYLDRSKITAIILRMKIWIHHKKTTIEKIPLSKIKSIHPITHGSAIEKTQARARAVKAYFSKHGIPPYLSTSIQEETIKSKNLIRAIKTDEDTYIIFDGNGRLYALREALKGDELEDFPIEIEIIHVEYSKIKHLLEKRRLSVYNNSEDLSIERARLYLFDSSKEEIEAIIADLSAKLISTRNKSLRSEIKKQRMFYQNSLIWRENGYSNAYKQGISETQLNDMLNRKVPLGFDSADEWEKSKLEIIDVLKESGIKNARVQFHGMATTFYNYNPLIKLGTYFKTKRPKYEMTVYLQEGSSIKKDKLIKRLKNKWAKVYGKSLQINESFERPPLNRDPEDSFQFEL